MPLFEQHAIDKTRYHFPTQIDVFRISLLQHNVDCFPDLTMGAAVSSECRRCFQDKPVMMLALSQLGSMQYVQWHWVTLLAITMDQ